MTPPRFRHAALAALALTLGIPTLAAAAITSSTITAPSGPFYAIDDASAPSDPTVTVAGTTNSTDPATDQVDLICTWEGSSRTTLASSVPLNPDGSFSADVPYDNFRSDMGCRIRAVPAGSGAHNMWYRFPGTPAFVADFSTSAISGGPNDGHVFNYSFNVPGPEGAFRIWAVGDHAIHDIRGSSSAYDDTWDGIDRGMDLPASMPTNDDTSAVWIDGAPAYTAYSARSRVGEDETIPGIPSIALTPALDARGIPTITERVALVRCNDESACTEFTPVGVDLARTYSFHSQGKTADVRDVFVSTDAAVHDVDASYRIDGGSSEKGMAFDGSDWMDRFSASSPPKTNVAPVTSAISFETDDDPHYGEENNYMGVTWVDAPEMIMGINADGDDTASRYRFTVPAGGEHIIRVSISTGYGMPALRDATLDAEEMWSTPRLSLNFPPDGAATTSDWAMVTGRVDVRRVFGVSRVPVVTVAGVAVSVAPDGSWSAPVSLREGANAIAVTAENGYGNKDSATVTVTRSAAGGGGVAPVTALAARGLTRGIVSRTGARRVTLGGKLVRPASLYASQACSGWVRLALRSGKRSLAPVWAPVRSDCTWRASLTTPRTGSLRVQPRFTGNASVLPRSGKAMTLRSRA